LLTVETLLSILFFVKKEKRTSRFVPRNI
jgi:hypothetical protein